jgi:putative tryptophan/tyrosine transport system substrate-binding protein
VIVASTNPVARAVRAVDGTVPIVWIGVDPIAAGLVTSLARPGGNITGVSLFDPETQAKRLQILKDVVPSASKVAYLSPRGRGKMPMDKHCSEHFRKSADDWNCR